MADLADLHCGQRPSEDGGGGVAVSQREQFVQVGGHEEEEFYTSFSPANDSSNPAFLDDYTSSFDFGFAEDYDCHYEDSDRFLFGELDDAEHMNYVTDLFEQPQVPVVEDPIWELESSPVDPPSSMVMGFALGGLRVVDMDPESDSNEFEVNSGFINHDEDDMFDSIETRIGIPRSADIEVGTFEWEEVGDRIQFDDRDNLNSVINRIEEILVSSDISSSEDAAHLEHDEERDEIDEENAGEVLLAMNNLERDFELNIMESNLDIENETLQVDAPDDYIVATDFNALFGLLSDNEISLIGSPPASKSAVENLQRMVLTNKDVQEKKVISCAVCKDDLTVGEKVTRMPCHHIYHGNCILLWLGIRNTCPVCGFELPTDDANYERRKSERGGHGVAG